MQDLKGKKVPEASDLEDAVIGALLIGDDHALAVYRILEPGDFYKPSNRIIFSACVDLYSESRPVDILTTVERLKLKGDLDKCGGPIEVARLSNLVASAVNVEYHSHIIKGMAAKREAIRMATDILEKAYDETVGPPQLIDDLSEALFRITGKSKTKNYVSASDAVRARSKELDEVLDKEEGDYLGIPTKITVLDDLIGGLQAPDLHIIAARPGMGKSALVTTILNNVSIDNQVPGAIWSLEMSAGQIVDRLISARASVTNKRVRDPRQTNPEELARIDRAKEDISDGNFWIDDTPGITLNELRAKAIELKRMYGIEYIIVDYLQLMSGSDSRQNREQEISTISRGLKRVAKELDIHIIALSQLSRAVEKRGGAPRPQLSDLRESGALEQDADLVGFLYRPEYYDIMEDADGESTRGLCELIYGKNRHGGNTTLYLRFEGMFTRFSDWAIDEEDNPFADPTPPAGDDDSLPF